MHKEKITNEDLKKSKNRVARRTLLGIVVGVVCGLYFNWWWLFGVIAFFSLIESMKSFRAVKEAYFVSQLKEKNIELDRMITEQEQLELSYEAAGFAAPQTLGFFLFSFLSTAIFGIAAKLIVGLF